MKEKLLAVLKPLVASKGLSKEEVEGLANIGVKNLTETSTDEDIKNAASGLVDYADLMQRVGNRMVTATENKYKGWIDPAKNNPIPKPEPEPKPNPSPQPKPEPQTLTMEQIQKLVADGIAEGLKPIREKEERARLSSLLNSNEKVAKIPEFFRKNYTLEKEEDLENVVSRMETEYAAAKQEMFKTGEFAAPPVNSGGGTGDTDDLINLMHKAADAGSNAN